MSEWDKLARMLEAVETPAWATRLENKINLILELEGVILTDQEHLDTDIASLSASFATIIAEIKNQPAAVAVDFTAADALVASVAAAAAPVVAAAAAPVADPSVDVPVDAPVADPVVDVPVADTSVASA